MTLTEVLTGIGDAIRGKEGSTEPIPAAAMASRIAAIPPGKVEYLVTARYNNAVKIYDSTTGSFVDPGTTGIVTDVSCGYLVVGNLVKMLSGSSVQVYWNDDGVERYVGRAIGSTGTNATFVFRLQDAVGFQHQGVTFTEDDLEKVTRIHLNYAPD